MIRARPRVLGAVLPAFLFFAVTACHAPDLTLQVAVSEDGAAAAWVRSGRRVLVVFLDDHPDPALVAPFLSDPELGQAIAVAYLAPTGRPYPRIGDAPAFASESGTHAANARHGAAADPVILPSLATGVSASWTADSGDGHGIVSIHARGVDWQIRSGGRGPGRPGDATGAGAAAADSGFDLVFGPSSTTDARWAITEALYAGGGSTVFPVGPGERVVYAATPKGTRRIDGPLPTAMPTREPPEASNDAVEMAAGVPASPTVVPVAREDLEPVP